MDLFEPQQVRVLCVDDEPGLSELVAASLERKSDTISAVSTTSSLDAVDYVRAEPVDAVVSDFEMPEMNGLELLDAIREVDPDLPFVLYTGKGSEEIASAAISRGVTEYMQKETGSEQYSILANRILNAVERSRTELRRRAERDRFQAVFEQASDAMILADDDGKYLKVNSAACDLFGRSEAEMLGRTAADFTAEDFDFETAWDSFKRIEDERGLYPVSRPDGEVRVAEYAASANVVPGEHLSVLRDVTDQRESERQVYLEKERFTEFAGVLSHDLKNPLQILNGHLGLMADGVDDAEAAEYSAHLEASLDAAARIEGIVEDVLTISQTGAKATDGSAVSFSALAERVWDRVRRGTARADVEPGIVFPADERRLERLLTNLFRNAIEHGGTAVSVRVGSLDDGRGFFVEDDGPGIPPDAREEVFDWKHSTKQGGTGIGLKSVRQIVDAQDWQIAIVDGTGGGARFEVFAQSPTDG